LHDPLAFAAVSLRTRSTAVTNGIRVEVQSQYLPQQSHPASERFVFAYRIRITNEGERPVQLLTRHWIVTHGDGHAEEVHGAGVVGEQPALAPGHAFEYTSGCILRTPRGNMKGTYEFVDEKGERIEAAIACFLLEMPFSLN
jgi:ApaG protein